MHDAGPRGDFQSTTPFTTERIHAAAVYCSDGRLGRQFDELIVDGLDLPRYDRLAVPGGAACLAGHFDAWREGEAALNQLKFLIDVHGLEHVVLVAHQNCAYYTQRLRVSHLGLAERQRQDLLRAVQVVEDLRRGLDVTAFFAKVEDGMVCFERVV